MDNSALKKAIKEVFSDANNQNQDEKGNISDEPARRKIPLR